MISDDYIDRLVETEIAHASAIIALNNEALQADPMSRYLPYLFIAVAMFTVLIVAAGLLVTIMF